MRITQPGTATAKMGSSVEKTELERIVMSSALDTLIEEPVGPGGQQMDNLCV